MKYTIYDWNSCGEKLEALGFKRFEKSSSFFPNDDDIWATAQHLFEEGMDVFIKHKSSEEGIDVLNVSKGGFKQR